jgi:predicted glycoside hydrolase/deacetylase ChbG (UPF0249 family)
MVFMEDSERAAELAKEAGIDVGLHLNLSQQFTAIPPGNSIQEHHARVVRFMTSGPYALVLYNPILRRPFRYVYQAQFEEFERLYGRRPSHIDGHQHRHLCANMLLDQIIHPRERVRRNFSYWAGEKNVFNRGYRRLVDGVLAHRYKLTDYFFSLYECIARNSIDRVFDLSRQAIVELMTHPVKPTELNYLMSDRYLSRLSQLRIGTYTGF